MRGFCCFSISLEVGHKISGSSCSLLLKADLPPSGTAGAAHLNNFQLVGSPACSLLHFGQGSTLALQLCRGRQLLHSLKSCREQCWSAQALSLLWQSCSFEGVLEVSSSVACFSAAWLACVAWACCSKRSRRLYMDICDFSGNVGL